MQTCKGPKLEARCGRSSICVSRADGGWGTLCIKIGYSKPNWDKSREGFSSLAQSSRVTYYSILFGCRNWRVFWCLVLIDWLTMFESFLCPTPIGCQQFFGFGHKPSVLDIIIRLRDEWLNRVWHREISEKSFFWSFFRRPAQIIFRKRTNCDARGYLYRLRILFWPIAMWEDTLALYFDRVKFGNVIRLCIVR